MDAIQVTELAGERGGDVLANKVAITLVRVRITLVIVKSYRRVHNRTGCVNCLKEFLHDHGLHFKATDMTVVDHHS